jgi:hypothetical protein
MKDAKKADGSINKSPKAVIDEKSLDVVVGGASSKPFNPHVKIGDLALNSGATWGKEVK